MLNGGELDGARILETGSVDRMGQNQIGESEAGEMTSVGPELSNDVHLFPGARDKFGLGFLINVEPQPGGRAEGSLMWAGLFNTYFWIDRKQGVGGVLLTQMLPFADGTVLEMLGEYEKAVYALAARQAAR
jgi:CubicO group peptidase (beta-lactamase class C family)